MSVQINIDVTDWADEYQREEPNLSTEEMAFVAKGFPCTKRPRRSDIE